MHDVVSGTLVPLLLRLGLAAVFLFHGQEKCFTKGHELGANWDTSKGAPHKVVQISVAWGELLCGGALAIGLLSRVAALGIIVIMGGAIWLVTGAHGFSILNHGYEYNAVLIVMAACLVLLGGGTLAVDRFFWFSSRRPPS